MCKKDKENKISSIDDTLTAILFHIKKLTAEKKEERLKNKIKKGDN